MTTPSEREDEVVGWANAIYSMISRQNPGVEGVIVDPPYVFVIVSVRGDSLLGAGDVGATHQWPGTPRAFAAAPFNPPAQPAVEVQSHSSRRHGRSWPGRRVRAAVAASQ